MKDLKAIFMGTPEFARTILENLIKSTHVVLVVSQPDKAVGRKKVLTPSPVKKLAEQNGIEVFTPHKIKENYARILEIDADIIITCAYGQIIPSDILYAKKFGAINVHASILPKYRGGAPIQRAIMNGEKKTGITIMYMDEHMDSGDIILQKEINIEETDNLDSLSQKLELLGANLLLEALPQIIDGTNPRIKQDESQVTFGYTIKREDELIDFKKSTRDVYNHIRALSSNPGAYFLLDDKQIKVYEAQIGKNSGNVSTIINIYEDGLGIATKDGEIIITKIKPEGKSVMSIKSYLNGVKKDTLKGKKVNDRVAKE